MTYIPGDIVNIHTELTNIGESTDVICETVIKKYVANELIDGLMLRTLEDFAGDASYDLKWNTISVNPGQYYIDMCLRDISGSLLDQKTQTFTITDE